jgi:hypothetical protein
MKKSKQSGICPVWFNRPTEAVDYKAPGSYLGAHEKLIPFKQRVNKFFFDAVHRGESEGSEGDLQYS